MSSSSAESRRCAGVASATAALYRGTDIGRPAIEAAAIDQQRRNTEHMRRERDERVVAVQLEVHDIGQWIFLGVDGAVARGLRQVADVDEDRLEAEPAEKRLMHGVVEGPDAHPLAIGRRPDRPPPVGDVAKAVVPEAEHPIAGGLRHVGRHSLPLRPVEKRIGRRPVSDEKRPVEQAERWHARGEIARCEIADVEIVALGHDQQIVGAAAGRHDAAGEFDLDAWMPPERVCNARQRAREDRAWRLVSGEADADLRHGPILPDPDLL